MTTMTLTEYNRHPSRAKQLADDGPVTITERGKPAYVLLSYTEYERLAGTGSSIADRLRAKGGLDEDIDLMDYIPPRVVEPFDDIDALFDE